MEEDPLDNKILSVMEFLSNYIDNIDLNCLFSG